MRLSCVGSLGVIALAALLTGITACTNTRSDNPDEIRRRTAEATETLRQDTKAVVEGVKEGMGKDNKPIDINKASRGDLLTLPGLTEREADRIIAGRPFDTTHDLVKRRVVSEDEYAKVEDRIIAGH